MVIACIGDSLTEGDYGIFGMSGKGNVQKENYPFYLSQLMECEVRNFGRCGARSSRMLQLYKQGWIDVKGADIVCIMLGTNGGQSVTEDTPENRAYRELVEAVRADAPEAKVILMTPPHATTDPYWSNCGYNAQVEQAALFTERYACETGLDVIDVYHDPRIRAGFERYLQPNDGLHLGRIGYQILAARVYDAIRYLKPYPAHTVLLPAGTKRVPLTAHRGLMCAERENTIASFTAACNHGYDYIETDFWKTKDGRIVLHHDPSTGCHCGQDLKIEEQDFDTLRSLRLYDTDGRTTRDDLFLPTPAEYLRICKKYGKKCEIELKSRFTLEETRAILDLVRKEEMAEDTVFVSVHPEVLKDIRTLAPRNTCRYICGNWNLKGEWLPVMIDKLRGTGIDFTADYFVLSRETVAAFHEAGIKVAAWTVDIAEEAVRLIDMGIDCLTTNRLEYAGND